MDEQKSEGFDKQTIVMCIMIAMIALLFFTIGYWMANAKAISITKNYLNNFIDQENLCLEPCMTNDYNLIKGLNATQMVEEIYNGTD